jgi:hypothetical protein
MKTKVLKTFIGVSMVYFLTLTAAFLPTTSFAENSQNLTIQTVELHPGDVINFLGGPATIGGANYTWGHSAMYLGIVDGEKKFLDFTTTKKNKAKYPYLGRILNAEEFLSENYKGWMGHTEFDVFRLSDTNTKVNQEILAKKAQEFANDRNSWSPTNNCAHVVAKVLTAATDPNTEIKVENPSGFAEEVAGGFGFYQLANGRVNIQAALNEVKEIPVTDSIIGTWEGSAISSQSLRFGVTLKIQNVTGGTGYFEGCSGTLSGTSSGGNVYLYNLNITEGRRTTVEESGCVDGTIILTLKNDGRDADYHWDGRDVDGTSMSSDGELHKTK